MDVEKKDRQIKQLIEMVSKERKEKHKHELLAEEYQRRIGVLSTCLQEMAEENGKLVEQSKGGKGILKPEASIVSLQEEIERDRVAVKSAEKQLRVLTTKLQREEDRRKALLDSNIEYERKLQDMEKEFKANLQKEGQRRKQAEQNVIALKKKIEELQRQLDEKGSDEELGSNSDKESDSES